MQQNVTYVRGRFPIEAYLERTKSQQGFERFWAVITTLKGSLAIGTKTYPETLNMHWNHAVLSQIVKLWSKVHTL